MLTVFSIRFARQALGPGDSRSRIARASVAEWDAEPMEISKPSSTLPDLVHGAEAARWGGWNWRDPRDGEWFGWQPYVAAADGEASVDA